MEANHTVETTVSLSAVQYRLNVIYVIIGSIGLVGNMFVCFVFCRVRRLRSITHLFIMNQSVIDMCSSLVFLALKFRPLRISAKGLAAELYCKFWHSEYLMWSLFLTSTSNMCAVTLERYFAICHPVFHRNHFSKTKAKITIVIGWVWGLPVELLWGLPFYHTPDGCAIKYIGFYYNVVFGIGIFSIAWLIPLILMAFCYVKILLKLRNSNVQPTDGNPDDNKNFTLRRTQKNVVKILLIVSITYAICWGPNEVALLHFNLGGYLDFTSDFYLFSVALVFCNMCVNPFIYAFQYKEFRKNIPVAFGCQWKTPTDTDLDGGLETSVTGAEGRQSV
ncbi:mu-type opioid receptor-like [Saccoglossus kowalevskii]|uniref:Mu-type opioid receptor-like n=1 Tax=Saccoglossus kowalevskii TaxID=10224 RepID=A0ABM0M516_SACKO|nr:PREDICTED: mu-type opioid receptor-like [Saccoglossus kowalevskii]